MEKTGELREYSSVPGVNVVNIGGDYELVILCVRHSLCPSMCLFVYVL